MARSCEAHRLCRRRPLLLLFPTPCFSMVLCQAWWSVPTRALTSPRMMSLSWDRGYEGVELFIKPVFDLIRAGHGWGVGTYQGGICLLSKWQLHFHKAIVETLRNAGEFMDLCCCDGKSHSCLLPLFAAASAPKKCVAANSLCQLAFAGEACLAKNRDINFIAIIFLWFRLHKRDPHQSRYTGQGELRQAIFRAPFLPPFS